MENTNFVDEEYSSDENTYRKEKRVLTPPTCKPKVTRIMTCCIDFIDGDFEEVILPEAHKHYSKMVCSHCKKFKKWGRNPVRCAEHNARIVQIDKAIDRGNLPEKQISFLKNIRDKRYLTPSQRQFCNDITADIDKLKI